MVVDFTEANQKVSDYSNVWTIYALVNKVQLGSKEIWMGLQILSMNMVCFAPKKFLTWIPKAF